MYGPVLDDGVFAFADPHRIVTGRVVAGGAVLIGRRLVYSGVVFVGVFDPGRLENAPLVQFRGGDGVDAWDELDGDMSTPDPDPDHIDPAADVADLIDAAESGELGSVDPGLEVQVRMARAVLDAADDGEEADP